jgi:hypothetical protein
MSFLKFNTEELVGRFEDRRDVKNLAGKYVMSLLLKKEPTILADLWSQREDISLGVNGGYYAGRKALEDYYASVDAATKQKAQVLKEVFPEDLGEYSDEKLYGRGPMEIRSLDNAIIEIADDGATAKGFFYVFGLVTDISSRGPVSNWVLGSICFDFIRENDAWKIWHVLYLEDVDTPAGQKWGDPKALDAYPEMKEFAGLQGLTLAQPNQPATLRALYDGNRPFTPLPRVPEPYDTFQNTFSYGAESQEALK